jgi:hypothetical protein
VRVEAFIRCFFADWADRFEYTDIDWLEKELFLAPPQGEKRQLDLVAKLKLKPGAPPVRLGVTDLVALVHVEVESRESTVVFRPRMFDYYVQLRRDTGLPVFPIAVFLRVGMDGTGWYAYEENFWEQRVLRFEYAYIGLPAVPGEQHATGENLLGVALSALMGIPAERKAGRTTGIVILRIRSRGGIVASQSSSLRDLSRTSPSVLSRSSSRRATGVAPRLPSPTRTSPSLSPGG